MAQSILKRIKDLNKNPNSEAKEYGMKKRMMDIFATADYYNEGIKKARKSFGDTFNFENISYLKLNNGEKPNITT